MGRTAKVRLTLDVEIELDGFEEPPSDRDAERDAEALHQDVVAFAGPWGRVLSSSYELLERPPPLPKEDWES